MKMTLVYDMLQTSIKDGCNNKTNNGKTNSINWYQVKDRLSLINLKCTIKSML